MFDAMVQGLSNVLAPEGLLMLLVGVVVGMVIAILPGLGGVVGLSICLPFIWDMAPANALILLIGIVAVMRTADTIPSVLFAVPGTSGAMATIIDGFALAKKGQAARALGAAFTASTIGALISAIFITISAPLARPLLAVMAAPEFFMLILLGVAMVGTLSGKQPLKGVVTALLGLLLATVGPTAGTFQYRYTFDQPYLFAGIPLIAMAMGLFAVPEIVDMLIGGGTISSSAKLGKGLFDGIKDVFRHWFLVLRCSAMGTFIGFLPGLGAGPACWFGYGHAVQSAKDKSQFGKGDIRGVIAPESANNAADGGAIIPALFFGIPGSGTMAIFLFAMLVLGIQPGMAMITTEYHLTFTIIWALALGAVMAAILSILVSRPIARLTTVRVQLLTPFIVIMVMLAAFQETRNWGDLIAVLSIGVLGWVMKQAGWPRPPVLVGFVLGTIAEQYLWLSIVRWGAAWLLRPIVIITGLAIIATCIFSFRRGGIPAPSVGTEEKVPGGG